MDWWFLGMVTVAMCFAIVRRQRHDRLSLGHDKVARAELASWLAILLALWLLFGAISLGLIGDHYP